MVDLKIVVDHDKIEYNGPFDANSMFRMIENHLWERGYDKRMDKDFEVHTQSGKFAEWQYTPWKKITDYIRYMVKVRVLLYNITKVDVKQDKRKNTIDNGKVVIYIDGYMDYDYDNYWEHHPMLFFFRMVFDRFVFKAYTERFEQRLTHDINTLHDSIEKFFNMHRNYTLISRPA